MNWFLMFDIIAIVYLISGLLCLIVWSSEYRQGDKSRVISITLAFLLSTVLVAYGVGRIFS